MVNKTIFSLAPTFFRIIKETDLGEVLKNNGFDIFSGDSANPPFEFQAGAIFALVLGEQKIGSEEMKHFPNLKTIARFGKGFEHIDLEAAEKRKIIVTNVPSGNNREVAEMTIALMLSLARNVTGFNSLMKENRWQKSYSSDISGKELGIIGLGHIGKEVAKMAKALEMEVSAFDVRYDEEFLNLYGIQKKDFETLLKTSDFITLNIPLSDVTKHLIDRRALSLMKPNVYLVNTSRGEVIESNALLEALKEGKFAGVALDVFSEEPPFGDNILNQIISHPKVIATPHVAGLTPRAVYLVASRVVHNILSIAQGRLEDIDRVTS